MCENSYEFPSKDLLIENNNEENIENSFEKEKIEKFFKNYKIDVECKDAYKGLNTITYIIDLKLKTKVSTIKGYKEDLMLYFNVTDVEFQIAINGTSYLGIHLINKKYSNLLLGDLIKSQEFTKTNKKIPLAIGKEFDGNNVIEDLTELPHLLIAGTTGTGKSNFLSTFIIDIIYKLSPDETKLVLVDTRKTNFVRFNGIPHLLIPVITESRKTIRILCYLIAEMNNRYRMFESKRVDNIEDFNSVSEEKLSQIVVVIEDFYDLMLETAGDIEIYIQKLIQISRAAGIHIIISTQRPSTNVLTGVIKANIPARIAFKVPSQIDSKTIIDAAGAEDLLMYGDILFIKIGNKMRRIQTPYITDKEIKDIIGEVKIKNESYYDMELLEAINDLKNEENNDTDYAEDEADPFLEEAIEYAIENRQISTSMIQRRFKVGYARAGRIIDQMEERGIITGYLGSQPRDVLISKEDWITNKLFTQQ